MLVEVGGHRLHVVTRGAGTPAVLLEAGIAASSVSWTLVQPQIATFARVAAYDRAGLGWSDTASSARSFARIRDELDAVRRHVQPAGRVILVGHSFGSLVVRSLAAHHPEYVAGLVLIDPPIEWLHPRPDQDRRLARAIRLSRLGALLAQVGVVRASLSLLMRGQVAAPRRVARAFGAAAAGTIERLVGEVGKLPPSLHPVVQAHWSRPSSFRAMADYLRVLYDEAPAIAAAAAPPREIPITVISGAHQPETELAAHRLMAEASEHGRHLVAAESGHWILFDRPDIVVDAVRALAERERSRLP